MPLTLPPLNALRAFEAAARHLSFAAAAEEIGVSAAAISQQIRKLEDYLGKQVFLRHNNRITLTDAGQEIFADFAAALQLISDATEEHVLKRSKSRLIISSIESVAQTWLIPRLAELTRAHPDFRFDLRVEPDPVDFARDAIDLRLGYDPAHYTDHIVIPLTHDNVLPICSPAYLQARPDVAGAGMAAVPDEDLIHTNWGRNFASLPTWQTWYLANGLPPPIASKGLLADNSAVVLDLAREGFGVALGQRLLAQNDLAAGRLVTLTESSLDLGRNYCLAFPRHKQRKRALVLLADWLIEAIDAGGRVRRSAFRP